MRQAIDIAIIPPETILSYCIDLNSNLTNRDLVLSRTKALPHISLAMAVVNLGSLTDISNEFESEFSKLDSFELEFDYVFKNDRVSGLGIKKNDALMKHHTLACSILKKYADYPKDSNDATVFKDYQLINYPQPASWVLEFFEKHSEEMFEPHITIGIGDIETFERKKFPVREISLYYLGPRCTCHTRIHEVKLPPQLSQGL